MENYPDYPLTDEEFNSFHRSDRALFFRLVLVLRRDPAESSRVMALWIWLEHEIKFLVGHGLIPLIILPLPDLHLEAIANESLAVLHAVEGYPAGENNAAVGLSAYATVKLPFLDRLVPSGPAIRFFLENRLAVVQAVAHHTASVCLRAFRDIILRAVEWRAEEIATRMILAGAVPAPPVQLHRHLYSYYNANLNPNPNPISTLNPNTPSYHPYGYNSSYSHGSSSNGNTNDDGVVVAEHYPQRRRSFSDMLAGEEDVVISYGYNRSFINSKDEYSSREEEIKEIERGFNIRLDVASAEEEDGGFVLATNHGPRFCVVNGDDHYRGGVYGVPMDERTIFLTFSKGYPITEREVRDFFASKYGGDVIEAVYMQEVRTREEQPLYARLVVRSLNLIDIVLEGNSRMKFSIAGKHVWARKYVRKNFLMMN